MVGWDRRLQGEGGSWGPQEIGGWISQGITSMLDPTQDMSFQPGPLHLHTNVNTTGVCLLNLQVVEQFLLLPKHTFTTPRIPIRSRRQRVERQVNQILQDETSQVWGQRPGGSAWKKGGSFCLSRKCRRGGLAHSDTHVSILFIQTESWAPQVTGRRRGVTAS